MFNTSSNIGQNWFEKCYGEIKNDLKAVLNSEVNVRTREIAAIKLGSLAVLGLASCYSIGIVSTILAGAAMAAALKVIIVATIIISAREIYIIGKNLNSSTSQITFTWSAVKICWNNCKLPDDQVMESARLETAVKGTLLEPVYKDLFSLMNKNIATN